MNTITIDTPKLTVLSLLLVTNTTIASNASFNPINGHWYSVNPTLLSWQDAHDATELSDGYLASITSSAENKWISETFGIFVNGDYYWFGGNDIEAESIWSWSSGEPWVYSNWNVGEPNNTGGNEHALTWFHPSFSNQDGFTWNDRPPQEQRASLVEFNSPILFNTTTEHWYQMNPFAMPWSKARDAATDAGGYLVSINSGEENKWISDNFGIFFNNDYYWLGANDIALDGYQPALIHINLEGDWHWSNGDKWTYTNWHNGEPNNDGGNEHALTWFHPSSFNVDGFKWNDRNPSQSRASLIEFDFDPLKTIIVNTTSDEYNMDGDCSLREAIISANTDSAIDACNPGSGDDKILLKPGTYTITIPGTQEDEALAGDLDITENLIIMGHLGETIVSGGDLDRVFHVQGQQLSKLTLSNLTIEHGLADDGGGIKCGANGLLELKNSTVKYNTAENDGGGIHCRDGLNIHNSYIFSNNAQNDGGGILATYFTITDSNIAYNSAVGAGGGLSGSDGSIADSIITNNMALTNGGGFSGAFISFSRSTADRNLADFGGGIFGVDISIDKSTISNNTARLDGGGVSFSSEGWITTSTISGNFALRNGGGWIGSCHNTCSITNSTITNNHAGILGSGIFSTQETHLSNSIIALNGDQNCFGNTTSLGYNLDDDNSCPLTSANDLPNVSAPLIGPLQDNGGPTLTHALLRGSPAIETGSNACHQTNSDQRGVLRPANGLGGTQEAMCDTGAFELSADLNNDGCVDRTNDLAMIMADVRQTETLHNSLFDLNGDGTVNIADTRFLVTLFTNSRGVACH